jgi:hypothetical protein
MVYLFVSYSRADEKLITPLVRLLRASVIGLKSDSGTEYDFVFQDTANLEAGRDWKVQIDTAISESERLFVFWCEHSVQSDQVRHEYELALSFKKTVVPILVDATPLPATLSQIHAVDIRGLDLHDQSHKTLTGGGEGAFDVLVREIGPMLGLKRESMMTNPFKYR